LPLQPAVAGLSAIPRRRARWAPRRALPAHGNINAVSHPLVGRRSPPTAIDRTGDVGHGPPRAGAVQLSEW